MRPTDERDEMKDDVKTETAALWVVCVLMSQRTTEKVTFTQTMSWRNGVTEDEARGSAVKFAMAERPHFSVEMITAADITKPPTARPPEA